MLLGSVRQSIVSVHAEPGDCLRDAAYHRKSASQVHYLNSAVYPTLYPERGAVNLTVYVVTRCHVVVEQVITVFWLLLWV